MCELLDRELVNIAKARIVATWLESNMRSSVSAMLADTALMRSLDLSRDSAIASVLRPWPNATVPERRGQLVATLDFQRGLLPAPRNASELESLLRFMQYHGLVILPGSAATPPTIGDVMASLTRVDARLDRARFDTAAAGIETFAHTFKRRIVGGSLAYSVVEREVAPQDWAPRTSEAERRFARPVVDLLRRVRARNHRFTIGTYARHWWNEFSVDVFLRADMNEEEFYDRAAVRTFFNDLDAACQDASAPFAWRAIYNDDPLRTELDQRFGRSRLLHAPGHGPGRASIHIHLDLRPLVVDLDGATGFRLDGERVVILPPPATTPSTTRREDYEDFEGYESDAPSEAQVGQLVAAGQHTLVDASATASRASLSFHDALRHALSLTGHSVILGNPLDTGTNFAVHSWTGTTPTPATVEFDARGVAALLLDGGARLYMQANLLATSQADKLGWVDVPGMREFLALPSGQQTSQRGAWIGALLRAGLVDPSTSAAFTRAGLEALSTPTLRVLLAHNVGAALAVGTHRRGGVVHGVTLSMLRRPLSEPHVYLRVISIREGKMESINAWDLEAGISLGPIQLNCHRGALSGFLWRVWETDRARFEAHFGAPLAWAMRNGTSGIELEVPVAGTRVWLRASEVTRNYAYMQSGDPARAAAGDVDIAFRRDLAARFRNLIAWPHIQALLEQASAAWLQPGLEMIHRAGIPALDPANPDRETFILKSLLMSTYVRFSGCLQPLLTALRTWTSVHDKLANWRTALASTVGPCSASGTERERERNAELLRRLGLQEREAATVHDEVRAVLGLTRTTTESESLGSESLESESLEHVQEARELSGAQWVARFPTSRSIGDLAQPFRDNVTRFVDALRSAGAAISIAATLRPPQRAYLMRFAWDIANGTILPRDVPPRRDVDIEWDHGNDSDSITAARAMVQAFGIVHRPSLTSHHIRGNAIDMDITWSGTLSVVDGQGATVAITSTPRTGAGNRDLHAVGGTFGVYKLRSDPPHWSADGH